MRPNFVGRNQISPDFRENQITNLTKKVKIIIQRSRPIKNECFIHKLSLHNKSYSEIAQTKNRCIVLATTYSRPNGLPSAPQA